MATVQGSRKLVELRIPLEKSQRCPCGRDYTYHRDDNLQEGGQCNVCTVTSKSALLGSVDFNKIRFKAEPSSRSDVLCSFFLLLYTVFYF